MISPERLRTSQRPEEDQEQQAEVSPSAVRYAAMSLLAQREHSRLELRQKLSRRFAAPELIDTVIQNLADEALQSEDRYAEAFVAMRKGKGQGPLRIRHDLQQRGIPEALISRYLEADESEWISLARSICLRKYGQLASKPSLQAKQMRFLQYRGFSTEQIRQAWKSSE